MPVIIFFVFTDFIILMLFCEEFLARIEMEEQAAFTQAVEAWRREKAAGGGGAVIIEAGGAFGDVISSLVISFCHIFQHG